MEVREGRRQVVQGKASPESTDDLRAEVTKVAESESAAVKLVLLVRLDGVWKFRMLCPSQFVRHWLNDRLDGFCISAMALRRIVMLEAARDDYGVEVKP